MSELGAEALVRSVAQAVPALDADTGAACARLLDRKTKPPGSLGRLEELAVRLAAAQGRAQPDVARRVVAVAAADHGVAREGVSAYPSEVTAQMVKNFAGGGAAVSVLARHVGARVVVIDMGVRASGGAVDDNDGVIRMALGEGTASITAGPAMARETAAQGVQAGIAIALALAQEGLDLLALGEMGIGNSTVAAAVIAALTGRPAAEVTGRGTGVDDAGLARKVAVVEQALAVNRAALGDPLGVLAAVGGFELCALAGLALGAASVRVPVVMDGVISTAAALVAARLAPALTGYLIAGHLSPEPGHAIALAALDVPPPLLALGMRLGEGSGATLAMALCEAACRVVAEMATFEAAGVSER
ncbi:MAG: nicotinate-nucleotide--dimethylbenzimidazole phosphoribosyltransferase [Deltaproteobacteria bacterium]|nr:nicotinate-nucleotide--dimethylbenzimidazole phosphoribosyltransferase [Deltaproteobacteria bacterium]